MLCVAHVVFVPWQTWSVKPSKRFAFSEKCAFSMPYIFHLKWISVGWESVEMVMLHRLQLQLLLLWLWDIWIRKKGAMPHKTKAKCTNNHCACDIVLCTLSCSTWKKNESWEAHLTASNRKKWSERENKYQSNRNIHNNNNINKRLEQYWWAAALKMKTPHEERVKQTTTAKTTTHWCKDKWGCDALRLYRLRHYCLCLSDGGENISAKWTIPYRSVSATTRYL